MPETTAMNLLESKHVWISMYGPAVESLKDAFFGQSVKVLQKCMGAKGETTQAEEEEGGRGEITPSDPLRTTENIKPPKVSPTMIVMAGKSSGAQKYIRVQQMYRIVLLGDTRSGKSSLANTMFGEDVFRVGNTECQAETKSVHGRRITLINTPDFFSPGRSEEELKTEILRCVTEFPPGPHAFLIVLKVNKSTEQQQQAVIQKICQYFSEEALKYAAVVFTQDDQVSDGVEIQDFIDQNKCVRDLVKKCKNRYHIINNYKQQGDNISNQFLNTIEQIVQENKGRHYTSKKLPQGDTCSNANGLIKLTGPAAESVAKAFTIPAVVVLTKGTTNEAQESSKTTDEENTANRGHTEKNTREDGKNEETKGGEEAKEIEAQKRTDGNINEEEQDQQPKESEEEREEEATAKPVRELEEESQEKLEGKEEDKHGVTHDEEREKHPKETEEEREEEATAKPVTELEEESQEKLEGKEEDKHGVTHDEGQEKRPKETKGKAEDRSQDSATKGKISGRRQAAGGAETAVSAVAAGVMAATGGAAAAIGAGFIGAASSAATAGVTAAAGSVAGATAAGAGTGGTGGAAGPGGAAGAAEATAAGAGTGGAGGAAGTWEAAGYVARVALATGGAIGVGQVMQTIRNVINCVKQHIGVVLLVLVFYSLLLSWFFLKVPFVGTVFLVFLLLLLVIILVAI